TLHDLQRDYLSLMVEDLPELHRTLIQAHTQRFPSSTQEGRIPWEDLPEDDPYLWDHLVFHLQAANLAEELETLGTNLRYVGKKLWIKGPLAIESDLRQIAQVAPTNHQVARMERIISQAAHLFVQQPHLEGVLTTLLSRMQDEPSLKKEVQRLEDTFTFPYLKAVWSMPDRPHPALLRTIPAPSDSIYSIDPTGQWLFTTVAEETLKVWNLATGALEGTYGKDARETGVIGEEKDYLQTVKWWQFIQDKAPPFSKEEYGYYSECFTTDGKQWLVSLTKDDVFEAWDFPSLSKTWTVPGNGVTVMRLQIDPTGQWVSIHQKNPKHVESLIVRSLQTGQIVLALENNKNWYVHLWGEKHLACNLFDPKGQRFIASGQDRKAINVWDLETGRLIWELKIPRYHALFAEAIDPTGQWLLSLEGEGYSGGRHIRKIKVWDLTSGTLAWEARGRDSRLWGPWVTKNAVMDPSGRFVIAQSRMGAQHKFKVLDLKTGQLVRQWTMRYTPSHPPKNPSGNFYQEFEMHFHGHGVIQTGSPFIVWNLVTGREVLHLETPTQPISEYSITPNGNRVVTKSPEGLKVWDLNKTWEQEATRERSEPVTCCAVDPTGQSIVTGNLAGDLKIWQCSSGRVKTLLYHSLSVYQYMKHLDTKITSWFSFWTGVFKILLRAVTEGPFPSFFAPYLHHSEPITTCSIHPSGQWFISTDAKGTLKIWDWNKGSLVRTDNGIAIDPSHRWVLSRVSPVNLSLEDTQTPEGIRVWDLEQKTIRHFLRKSPWLRWLAKIGDALSQETVSYALYKDPNLFDEILGFDSTGRSFVTLDSSKTIRTTMEVATGKIKKMTRSSLDGLDFGGALPNSRWVVGYKENHTYDQSFLALCKARTGSMKWWHEFKGPLRKCTIDATGRWIVGTTWHNLMVWKRRSGKLVCSWDHPSAKCLTINSTKQLVAIALVDTLYVYEMKTGKLKQTLIGHRDRITCCDIDPLGNLVVTGSEDHTLKIWELETGNLMWTLEGHSSPITCCAIDSRGQWVASGDDMGVLNIWEVATGTLQRTLEEHCTSIQYCKIDPTSQRMITRDSSGLVKIWELPTGNLIRNLNCDNIGITYSKLKRTYHFTHSGPRVILPQWGINILEFATGKVSKNREESSLTGCILTIDPKGRFILTEEKIGVLNLWEWPSEILMQTFTGHTNEVTTASLDLEGKYLASGDQTGKLCVWEVSTGRLISTIQIEGKINELTWVPNHLQLVVAGMGGLYQFELLHGPNKE
ncbi:MAG: hypothetical protein KC588_16800, partial [Nitrospira sp.]|nr:hypothetical protein [Nitrospira sp.]